MSDFAECALIKLVPSEAHFVALTTFDIVHGRSTRFLLRKSDLATLANNENASPVLDTDIGSYVQITRNAMRLLFRLTLLHQDVRNEVTGYVHYFELPISKINAILNGQSVYYVEYTRREKPKAQLQITESGHYMLRKICQDKLTKHVMWRFFCDHFN